jgi:hypothetical protein
MMATYNPLLELNVQMIHELSFAIASTVTKWDDPILRSPRSQSILGKTQIQFQPEFFNPFFEFGRRKT